MDEGEITAALATDGCWDIRMQYGETGVLTPVMTAALMRAVRNAPAEARFALLRAEGPDFCAGRQSPTPQKGARVSFSDLRTRVADPVLEFYDAVRNLPVPLICAVRGRAFGAGCALAALGDLIVAEESARFAIPEMNRDLPPLLVMTALADRIARAHLARLVLTREEIGAREAVQIGLASMMVPAGGIDAAVATLRETLATNSPVITSTVKRFLSLGPEMTWAQRREYAAVANPGAMTERFLPD